MTLTITPVELRQVEIQARVRRFSYAIGASRYVAGGGLLYTCLTLLLWWRFPEYPQLLYSALTGLPLALCAFLCTPLHRAGKSRLGVIVFLSGILSVALLVPPLMPEILPATPIGYVAIIIIAYISLDKRDGHWFAAISTIGYLGDILLAKVWSPRVLNLLPNLATVLLGAGIGTFAVGFVSVIIYHLIAEQNTGFYQAQVATLETEKRARAEQHMREEIQSTVDRYVGYMSEVGHGRLAARLALGETVTEAPLGVLGQHLNETVASLHRITIQVQETAGNMVAASTEILAAASQQADGASQQSQVIAEASATIGELRAIAEQTAQRAQGVADVAQRTRQVSQAGQQAVTNAIQGMVRVKEYVETITSTIAALAGQTQAIGKIIVTVKEIAAQSNLLALNAAVEAARAGQAGRSFAVVAQEVRNLAGQSRLATEEVRRILSEIQDGVQTAVAVTEEGLRGTEDGMRLSKEAGVTIEQLAASVTESAQAAAEINAAAGQQLGGMEQLAAGMQNIEHVAAQTVAGTRQTERAAEELYQMADHLREAIELYEL